MKNLFRIVLSFALAAVIGLSILNFGPKANAESVEVVDSADPLAILYSLDEVSGAKDVRSEYRHEKTLNVAYGKIYKYLQVSGEYDVYGSDLSVAVDKEGKVLWVDGGYIKVPALTQNLTETDAIDVLLNVYGEMGVLGINKLVYAHEREPELAYEITVTAEGGLRCYVSALTGEILYSTPLSEGVVSTITQTDAYGNDIEIDVEYRYGTNEYSLVDNTRNIFTYDAQNQTEGLNPDVLAPLSIVGDGGAFDPIAVTAYDNMVKAYDFYTDPNNVGVAIFGVDGNNDNVANNYSQNQNFEVRIAIFVHYDRYLDNAFCQYNEEYKVAFICIGDGAFSLKDPAKALDILGHEYQHALTGVTADLNYVGESGALNEAFSDIFGALIEGKEGDDFWEIGEDGVNTRYRQNLRSLIGGTDGQKYDAAEKFVCTKHTRESDHTANDSSCDANGVHFNSTIISHVQYKMSQEMPEFFTHDRIGQLWYATLCSLNSTSDFEDFSIAFLRSAMNLGYSQDVINVIRESLDSSHLLPENAFHTVTFLDYDDSVIATYEVLDGNPLPSFPPDPVRENTPKYTYRFNGWDTPISNVTSDIVTKAMYNVFVNEFTIVVYDMMGEKFFEETYEHGFEFGLDVLEARFPEMGPNWTFNGLYTDEAHTNPVETEFIVEEDLTLYAYWDYISPEQPQEDEPNDSGCGTVAPFAGGNGQGGAGLMIGLTLLAGIFFVAIFSKKNAKQN